MPEPVCACHATDGDPLSRGNQLEVSVGTICMTYRVIPSQPFRR